MSISVIAVYCAPRRHAWPQSYLRMSSITLPSFGSSPGARNATSPRSLVTSRIEATIASALRRRLPVDLARAASCGRCRPALSTTRRALSDLRVAPHDLGDLRRMHEHALHLGRLVGAAHPALDAHVGAAAGARARQHRRQVAGGEADQRIVGLKSVVTTTSPTSPAAPDRRCRAARSRPARLRRRSCPRAPRVS